MSQYKTKADFIAAWKASRPPQQYTGMEFDALLMPLGVLAPVTAFITHVLFGGITGGRWLGKSFSATSEVGFNRFSKAGSKIKFQATVQPSRLDGKPALALVYSNGDSTVWGSVMHMRDELREVAPGVWLGLGSMALTGGMLNSAPFIMFPTKRAQ